MKTPNHTVESETHLSRRASTVLSTGAITCACLVVFTITLSQRLQAEDTAPVTEAPAPITDPTKIEDISTQPSRYISEGEMDTYLSVHSSKFAINSRRFDPFGQVQDMTVKKVIKDTTTKGPRRFTPIKPTPFSDVIQRIQVTTIMPSENKFLIGTRSFKKGDIFPITYKNRGIDVKIDVKIIAVTSQKIDFENTKTGEVASVKLSLMPAGMQSGTSGIHAPGMEPKDQNAPLRVGSSN